MRDDEFDDDAPLLPKDWGWRDTVAVAVIVIAVVCVLVVGYEVWRAIAEEIH